MIFVNPIQIKVSYAYYYGKVKTLNISFVKLGGEECEKYDLHDRHLEESHQIDIRDVNVLIDPVTEEFPSGDKEIEDANL